MASTTKAGKLWQLMHSNNNFGPSLLLAVSNDDTDGVQSALDLVDLSAEELHLADDEIKNLFEGVTPSGALELTTWQAYYVTNPLPNGDKYALLILSYNNTVYWGPEKDLIGNFENYEVSYQLPTDGKLQFSTSAGDVKLKFSRTYDIEKGDIGLNSFTGTLGDKAISGTHTRPPWPADESTKKTTRQTTDAALTTDPSVPWYQMPGVSEALAILGLLGGAVAAVQAVLWARQFFKKLTRKPVAEHLKKVLTENQALALAVASSKVKVPEIHWSSARDEFTNTVEQKLNRKISENGIDIGTADPQTVVESLGGTARESLKTAFEAYAYRSIKHVFLNSTDGFKAFPEYSAWAQKLANAHSGNLAAEKLDSFEPALFDALCCSVVFQARRMYFHNSYEAASLEAATASAEYTNAKKLRENTEQSIRDIDVEIQRDKENGDQEAAQEAEERKRELEVELEERKKEEKVEEEESKAAETRRQDAETKDKESEESDKGKAEEEKKKWEEGMEKHGV